MALIHMFCSLRFLLLEMFELLLSIREAIWQAALFGHLDIVKYLINKAGVDKNERGRVS